MSGFYLRVKSTNSKIKTYFNPPIELGDRQKYEMALVGLETYHSFPNITSANNVFRYSPNNPTPYTSQKEVMKLMRLTIIFKPK